MWSFVGRRKRRVWLWLAVEWASRRVVAWELGCRGAATARQLRAARPRRYQRHCRCHTAQWEAYTKALPAHQHRAHPKGSGKTNFVEAISCSLRRRCGVSVHKSCSFSKDLPMHTARIKTVIDNYNLTPQ